MSGACPRCPHGKGFHCEACWPKFEELLASLRTVTADYRSLREAFYGYPGRPGDGDCPAIAAAEALLAKYPR